MGRSHWQKLHKQVEDLCRKYINEEDYYEVAFKTDIANLIGVCVVSGNVRRSAEIALGAAHDHRFWDLKNYEINGYRAGWGWMSNNSIRLETDDDFQLLPDLAYRNMQGHDLGYLNMVNFKRGRIKLDEPYREDFAVGINPCGEIPLEDGETCNVVETCPTVCPTRGAWLQACRFATFYASTVALLPTHRAEINSTVIRNRRIGVSLMDWTSWIETSGLPYVIESMREGYKVIRQENKRLASEAGVPESIRVTTVKPGGTVPKLPARISGISYPTFEYMIRRINVGKHEPMHQLLVDAKIPHEDSMYTDNTSVFEFPVQMASAPAATTQSLWKQAMNVVTVQREWADNAVSNTLYFNPETEKEDLSNVLAAIAPLTKSVSVLPHTEKGAFAQMPEEGITKEEYEKRVTRLVPINFAEYRGSDGEDERYCDGDKCSV